MPDQLIVNNTLVQFAIANIRNELNVGHAMRLFVNDYTPTPASTVLDFQEASFPGYARWNLDGVFPPQVKVRDGFWAFATLYHTFLCVAASSQTVYGWFIIKDFLPKVAYRLPTPVPLGFGVNVTVRVVFETIAKSLFPLP